MYADTKVFLGYNPTQGEVADDRADKAQQPSSPLNGWVHLYWQLKLPKGPKMSVVEKCQKIK
ncbi:hypothetical protein [Planctobacterium marinum]|uniref:hypothetical protein n=1 Tax=Planctobacterium marinum TaxID=1631968 RepID=UPI001E632E7D|nr:hypothetical protein [Planctobacterium marinum]MCC2607630.1 hypothetical protein [Planctobacterium marinum]